MTCIVALVDHGKVYFAGDSLCVNVPTNYHAKGSQVVRRETKVWARDGMVFGGNGDVRMLQLVCYSLIIPAYTIGRDKVQYLVTQFIPSLQECFEKAKFRDDGIDGNILLSIETYLRRKPTFYLYHQ